MKEIILTSGFVNFLRREGLIEDGLNETVRVEESRKDNLLRRKAVFPGFEVVTIREVRSALCLSLQIKAGDRLQDVALSIPLGWKLFLPYCLEEKTDPKNRVIVAPPINSKGRLLGVLHGVAHAQQFAKLDDVGSEEVIQSYFTPTSEQRREQVLDFERQAWGEALSLLGEIEQSLRITTVLDKRAVASFIRRRIRTYEESFVKISS